MKLCNGCGIILNGSITQNIKQVNLCKYCYRQYQKEQFEFWYDKQPKKPKHKKECVICHKEFESSQPKANVCSRKCKLKKKIILEKRRIANA